ncbi:MAG: alpha-amylase family glycosyl hydrolase [Lachnospiraceae bacterium]|nr:alpha-amylase family glycosyl hydrolase [Lachnospiraceae bacterium]
MPSWLNDAVFYEIYPQSFKDTNGDGIGDIEGIIRSLDYIKSLGMNALWLNPCFDSPFKDAGYDVRDYKKVAPRYGTNDDLVRLFDEAHKRGMHVLLDLVAGHSSEEHEWFKMSSRQAPNEYSGRYIWTSFCFEGMAAAGYNFIAGESERSGSYIVNFFKCQPALNYGFLKPTAEWQDSIDSENALATREALKDIMRFWMDKGCDGFRVDMAASLVKNDDEKKTGTSAIWHDIRAMMDADYPECALLAEWSDPRISIPAGFHMDFLLNNPGEPYPTLLRDYMNHTDNAIKILAGSGFNGDGRPMPAYEDHSFFKKDAGGDIRRFLDGYLEMLNDTNGQGYISIISCNHDTVRPSYTLETRELKLFYDFLYTMPGIPFLYYGDEIGMRYLNIPTREGGYFRTGSRTPMQWAHGKNLGFSTADPDELYLPVDPSSDAPTVESAVADPASLYAEIRTMAGIRHREDALKAKNNLEVLFAEGPVFIYRRGNVLLGLNTASAPFTYQLHDKIASCKAGILHQTGDAHFDNESVTLGSQSFLALKLS